MRNQFDTFRSFGVVNAAVDGHEHECIGTLDITDAVRDGDDEVLHVVDMQILLRLHDVLQVQYYLSDEFHSAEEGGKRL